MKPSTKVWGTVIGGISGLALLIASTINDTTAVEGGYVNNKNDPGGATNHGITEQVARANGFKGDIQEMPREFAEWVYAKDYVYKPRFDLILAESPAVGHKTVDGGVNAGPGRSARWFQQSLNSLSRGGLDYPKIAVDGQVGPGTIAAFQALERKRGRVKACEMVLKLMDAQQASHYMKLAEQPKLATFIVGWVDHRVQNIPLSRCPERVA